MQESLLANIQNLGATKSIMYNGKGNVQNCLLGAKKQLIITSTRFVHINLENSRKVIQTKMYLVG